MSKQATREDIKEIVIMVLAERKIALPSTRLKWYVKWFGFTFADSAFYYAVADLEREGVITHVEEGGEYYWRPGNRWTR